MTVDMIRQDFMTTPDLEPLRGTLLDAATVEEGDSSRWANLIGMYESYACMPLAVATALCPLPTDPKTFSPVAWPDGFQFAVQGGVTCKTIGFDRENAIPELTRIFELRESIGIERALMETRFVAGPDTDPGAPTVPQWPEANDLTPVDAVTPTEGLAILEGHAAAFYAGVPTIHMPRTIGTLLGAASAIGFESDGKLRSDLGSKIAAGGGYDWPNNGPDGSPAPPGEKWMYASGAVSVRKGALIAPENAIDFVNNDVFGLVERFYTVVVDCYTAAIRVKVESA